MNKFVFIVIKIKRNKVMVVNVGARIDSYFVIVFNLIVKILLKNA